MIKIEMPAVKRTGQSNRARSVQCAFVARRQEVIPAQFASIINRQAAKKWANADRISTAFVTKKQNGWQPLAEKRKHILIVSAFPLQWF